MAWIPFPSTPSSPVPALLHTSCRAAHLERHLLLTHCRVGIIGDGANTKLRHIPELLGIPGVKVATVCNRTIGSSRVRATAAEHPALRAW